MSEGRSGDQLEVRMNPWMACGIFVLGILATVIAVSAGAGRVFYGAILVGLFGFLVPRIVKTDKEIRIKNWVGKTIATFGYDSANQLVIQGDSLFFVPASGGQRVAIARKSSSIDAAGWSELLDAIREEQAEERHPGSKKKSKRAPAEEAASKVLLPSPMEAPEVPGLFESLLPKGLLRYSPVKRFLAIPAERRDVLVTSLFAALIFIPWLGAVGLWDPWEVHYGEVARTMVAKQDYVFPYWENAYFFSKPPLTMWLQALGIWATGSLADNGGPLGTYIEWGMRLPFALLSILAVALITLAAGRVFNRRTGLIAGFATATSPLYFLLARQTVTDTPFVTLMACGLAAFMIAELDPKTRGELNPNGTAKTQTATFWWCLSYAFFGLATLAKGLLGFMLPGLILLVYLLITWDWKLLRRARVLHGIVLLAVIVVPWYLTLSLFDGKDDESKTFVYRFFVHDHFKRLGEGVHTTTPGGTFAYFIEQLGFAIFPWVALVPGAMVAIGKLKARDPDTKNRGGLFVTVWAAASFFLFALSATKFHHYCFPVLPALTILCAIYADKLWREGMEGNAVPVLLGIGFFAAVAQNLWLEPKHLINLYVYNYERPYPSHEVDPKRVFSTIFVGGGLLLALAYVWRTKKMLVATFATIALSFALYTSWVHWKNLSFHWSQRDIFWAYYQQRASPEEPIGAYYMNWRGETFYSSNRIRQIKDGTKFQEFLNHKGPLWLVVEQSRFNGMKNIVEQRGRHVRIADRSCNKFFLVSVD